MFSSFLCFFVDRDRKGRLSRLFSFFFYSTYGHTHQQRNREVDREELTGREKDLGLPPCKAKRAGIFFQNLVPDYFLVLL
jgi:hypothetical protein